MNTAERITLNFPIEHDGLPIKEIALRRPTVGLRKPQRTRRHRSLHGRLAHAHAAYSDSGPW